MLHDEDLGDAIVDRILERGTVLRLDGPSVRSRHVSSADLEAPERAEDQLASPARISGTRICALVQRTTAQEQPRRLIAAELPQSFLDAHGGAVTVENHLDMLLPILANPVVDTRTLSAFLNSSAADRASRCISGTVAVSAYELKSMPLPPPSSMQGPARRLGRPHDRGQVENYCNRL